MAGAHDPSALARLHPPPRRRDELTSELADQLVAAATQYLFFEQIALACGVEPDLLESWIGRGRLPNAPPLFANFATRFLAADAAAQAGATREFLQLARRGKRADQLLKLIEMRWPQGANPRSIEARTSNAAQTEAKDLFANPPPALVAALHQSGIIKHLLSKESLETPEAQAVLKELGYTKSEG